MTHLPSTSAIALATSSEAPNLTPQLIDVHFVFDSFLTKTAERKTSIVRQFLDDIEGNTSARYPGETPTKQLIAYRRAVSDLVQILAAARLPVPIATMLQINSLCCMLTDMERRNSNALVTWAATAGRRGKRPSSISLTDERHSIGLAVETRYQIAKRQVAPSQRVHCIEAADWVASALDRLLQPHALSLAEIFPGQWRTDTAERARQRKRLPSRGKRLMEWRRSALQSLIGTEQEYIFAATPARLGINSQLEALDIQLRIISESLRTSGSQQLFAKQRNSTN